MKTSFRYFRDGQNRPLVTECVIYDDQDQPLSGGLAICSPRDNPCKAVGRNIALRRAFYGASGVHDLPIRRKDANLTIISTVDSPPWLFKAWRY